MQIPDLLHGQSEKKNLSFHHFSAEIFLKKFANLQNDAYLSSEFTTI